MPSLRELIDVARTQAEIAGHMMPDSAWCAITKAIRLEFGGQRIYVPPVDSRKDPDRREALRKAAKRLPTGVAAEVTGVSASYLYRVRKGKK